MKKIIAKLHRIKDKLYFFVLYTRGFYCVFRENNIVKVGNVFLDCEGTFTDVGYDDDYYVDKLIEIAKIAPNLPIDEN